MKTLKRYIINLVLYSIVSLWMFSSCEDYDFKDIPDPVIPEDMTPGLKLSQKEIMIDAMGNAQGFELRSIGGGWSIAPIEEATWVFDYEPKSGDEGNAVVGITLKVNEGMQERYTKFVVRQENTGITDTVLVGQYTYESQYTRRSDSLALLVLHESLNGEGWRNPWNPRKPMTEWSGVTLQEINGELRVTGLLLSDFSLSGNLPNEIGNLRELTSLRITGKVYKCPNSLINLRKLESLNVNFSDGTEWFLPNDMSSMLSLKEFLPGQLKIPMESFAGLYTLPALEKLAVSTIYLIGDMPEGISRLRQLKSLDLAGTNIYSLPDDIGEIAETLTTLNLGGCQALSSLGSGLGQLTNLTSLTLSGCKVLQELPDSFGNLGLLTSLDLSGCERLVRLSDDIGNLNISSINFSGCTALKTLPESFGKLSKLTTLNFSGCTALETLPESIGEMSNVTEMNLSNCNALNSLPVSIGKMKLKKLTMTKTALTTLPAVLGDITSLEELDITGTSGSTGMFGVAGEAFGRMTGLKKLSASDNSFTGDLAWLQNLTKLTDLRMDNNQLSGTINWNHFGMELTNIYLTNNDLEGTLDGISRLTKLRYLYLNQNQLSGTLPAELGNCSTLNYLVLDNNNITGTIPVEVANMNLGYSGLVLKQNKMSGEIPAEVLSSALWKKLYPDTNIYPQQEGYGFSNVQ
ncbi:MAG: leucine-rich repeat domain-containing protein [Butyricimonas virosa]